MDEKSAVLPVRNELAAMNANMERLAKASEAANGKMGELNATTQQAPAAMKAAILEAWHTIALEVSGAIVVALVSAILLGLWKKQRSA